MLILITHNLEFMLFILLTIKNVILHANIPQLWVTSGFISKHFAFFIAHHWQNNTPCLLHAWDTHHTMRQMGRKLYQWGFHQQRYTPKQETQISITKDNFPENQAIFLPLQEIGHHTQTTIILLKIQYLKTWVSWKDYILQSPLMKGTKR